MILKNFDLKSNTLLNNITLFYGSNDGHKDEILNNFIKIFDGEILRYDESDLISKKDNFLSEIKNESLFNNQRLLIISRATNKVLEVLGDLTSFSNENISMIILCENLEKKSKLRQLFEKNKKLICVAFYDDDERSLLKITNEFLSKEKIKISQESINLLIQRAKGDRKNLKNELSKLKFLLISRKNIDIEDVSRLSNLAENYSVFELTENYLAKNSRKVSNILNENNFSEEDCILILRTILNRSKRLLKLINSYKTNGNIDLTISSYKPPIFWKEKEVVKKQIKSWSIEEIRKTIYKINDLETLIKKNSRNSLNFMSDFVRNY